MNLYPDGPYAWLADNFWSKIFVLSLVVGMMVYGAIQSYVHGDVRSALYLGVKYELPGQNALMLRTNPDLGFIMPRNDNFEGMLVGCRYRFKYWPAFALIPTGNEPNYVRSAQPDWCPPPAVGQSR
jgi:hypothetical protein